MKTFKQISEELKGLKKVVIAVGRMNPPTKGHQLLVDVTLKTAKKLGADHFIFPTKSHDGIKNPLPFKDKMGFIVKAFPKANISKNPRVINPWSAVKEMIEAGYRHIVVVSGEDRSSDFLNGLRSFVNKEWPGEGVTIDIALSGNRSGSGIEEVSASKMRMAASQNDYKTFKSMAPDRLSEKDVKNMFAAVRKNLKRVVSESEINEMFCQLAFMEDFFPLNN